MSVQLVNLLFVDDHLTEIETITRTLSHAGYLVQKSSATALVDIERISRSTPLDLVFYNVDASDPPASSVRAKLEETQGTAAMLALSHRDDPPERTAFLRAGMRDLVSSSHLELLVLVSKRELADLNSRRRARQAIELIGESEQRCHDLLDTSEAAIAYVHEGAHIYANPKYLQLFGFQNEGDVEGLPLMNLVAPQDRDGLKKLLKRYSRGDHETDSMELTGLQQDQSEFPVELTLQLASMEGEPCVQVVFRDTTPDDSVAIQLEEMRKRDVMTGLYNRQHLKTVLDDAHQQAANGDSGGALIYLLLDQLREISKTYGLTTGDQLVKNVSELLKQHAEEQDTLVRYDNSVLMILTPRHTSEELMQLGENLRQSVEHSVIEADSRMVTTTCCIGIALFEGEHADAGEIIKQADQACEESRKAGGNRVTLYQSSAGNETATELEALQTAVEEAIASDRFVLQFQAIASLTEYAGERFAAMAAVRNDQGELVSTDAAFPMPEDCRLFGRIDQELLMRALSALRKSAEQRRDVTLFVPLSTSSMKDRGFLEWMGRHIPKGAKLVLEIPETAAERYFRQCQDLARLLHDRGCKLALVDLGDEHTAERLIEVLHVDFIKFRADVVAELGTNETARNGVERLAAKIRELGGDAIADHISGAQQLAGIWQTSLTLIQGDFVAYRHEAMEFDFEQFVA